ncbi:MAG: phytanoyl-CoA dioxygenase family protein [Bacteroidetes bacterium]|nr:phytanoyl-CoA dioxygenase family protein [Bacteroidota bacterium]
MFSFPDKMMPVFREESHQAFFEKNGYVILPFYDPAEISELEALYHELHPRDEHGFFPSTFSHDKNYRLTADREIRRICQRGIDLYCRDVKVMCGAFIVKTPGPESAMCVHQDMSLVDESRYTGINIWVPLCDLSVTNGTLFVLPGSHRLMPTYRGSSIPEFFAPVMDDMIDYMVPVEIKAGEAVFFDQSIIHYSPPNYSEHIRIVTNTYFTHKDAAFRTYYWDEAYGGRVEAFAQNDSFMLDFEQFGDNIRDRPKVGESLGLVEYTFPKITKEYLAARFRPTGAREMISSAVPAAPMITSDSPATAEIKAPGKSILQRIKELIS